MRGGFGRGFGQGPMVAGGRRGTGAPLPPAVRQAMEGAHALLKAGDAAGAADRFAELASRAEERGRPGIAAFAALLGAQARATAGDANRAVDEALAASVAGHGSHRPKVARRYAAVSAALRAGGHAEAADRLDGEVRSRFGITPAVAAPVAVNRSQRRHLPKSCSACSGPVTDAVVFDDDGSADCTWCGTNLL